MKKMLQRGFTLIELLVVIAIIGILAAVVLASLNDARDSGSDAAIKQSIGNARSQAEIFYNSGGYTYLNVCDDPKIAGLMDAAMNNNVVVLSTSTDQVSTAIKVTCNDTAAGYAIHAPINNGQTALGSWCADSSGFAGEVTAGALGTTDTILCQ